MDIYNLLAIVLNLVALVFMVFQYLKDRGNPDRRVYARNELLAVILLLIAVVVQVVTGVLHGKH